MLLLIIAIAFAFPQFELRDEDDRCKTDGTWSSPSVPVGGVVLKKNATKQEGYFAVCAMKGQWLFGTFNLSDIKQFTAQEKFQRRLPTFGFPQFDGRNVSNGKCTSDGTWSAYEVPVGAAVFKKEGNNAYFALCIEDQKWHIGNINPSILSALSGIKIDQILTKSQEKRRRWIYNQPIYKRNDIVSESP